MVPPVTHGSGNLGRVRNALNISYVAALLIAALAGVTGVRELRQRAS